VRVDGCGKPSTDHRSRRTPRLSNENVSTDALE
jgi:hypothetical protein